MSDEVIKTKEIEVQPQLVGEDHTFADLREVTMRGAMVVHEVRRRIEAHAAKHDMVLGEIKGRWVYEAEAMAYPVPEDLYPEDASGEMILRARTDFARIVEAVDRIDRGRNVLIDRITYTGEHNHAD